MIRSIVLLGLLMVISPAAWGQPQIVAVVNSATYQSGLPYGGALATAYVSGLAGLKPGTYIAPLSQPLPSGLGGIVVGVNGALAPILAVVIPSDPSANIQVNFQVPSERNTNLFHGGSITGGIITDGSIRVNEAALALPGAPVWGGFFDDGNGYAVALHASDSSSVTLQNPAHPGESIIVYADDFFLTWPPPTIGIPAPPQVPFQLVNFAPRDSGYLYLQSYPQPMPCPFPENPLTCTNSITNTPALQIAFEGLAVGKVGVEEIDFVIPPNQRPGNWALFFNRGSCPDGSGVPGTCGSSGAASSPYVLLPVAGQPPP